MNENDLLKKEEDILKSIEIMEVVEKELNQRKKESTFSFTVFIGAVCVWVLFEKLWEFLGQPIPPKLMTVGVEIIAVFMLVVVLWKTSIKLSEMGITKKNLFPSLIRGAIVSAILLAVFIVFKMKTHPGEAIFDWSLFDAKYILTSVLQEFLARGFLLTCLINMYDSKNKKHIAVILSSILFTALHLYYGFAFMVGAGVLSIVLGYLYLVDKNIWGVSLIHFVFGSFGLMLGLI